jgi:hypothetical protein
MSEVQPQQPDNTSQNAESLSLQDLLADEKANVLSDYLSVSISSVGADAKVSFTTTDAVPVTYSSILYGVSATERHSLLADTHNLSSDI